MESSTQEVKPGVMHLSIPWVLVLIFAGFAGGVFVGLHPSWVPIPGFVAARAAAVGDDQTPATAPSVSLNSAIIAAKALATQPTTQGQ